jgi:outer membrane protein assembly factor BamB
MGTKVLKRGSKWVAETLWQNQDLGVYMNSPLVSSDLLFGLSYLKRGQFFCLDPRNGVTLWTSDAARRITRLSSWMAAPCSCFSPTTPS